MNRADIRQAIFDQIDWQPDTSTDLKNKLDRFINRAYQQLALEAPFLFFEDKAHFRTQPDAKTDGSITNDGLTQVTVPINTPGLVWSRTYDITDAVPSGDDASITEWDLDPSAYVTAHVPHPWDGRWLEVTDSAGRVHRRRIRRIWWENTTNTGAGTHTDYISLDKPLDLHEFSSSSADYTRLDYRIYTQSYYLPADTIEVRSLRIWSEQKRETISLIYAEEAEEQWWDDIQGSSASGSPRKAFRTDFFQLSAPTLAPRATVIPSTLGWSDNYQQPQGTFEFFYTICWGALDKTHIAAGDTTSVSYQRYPRWESAPSDLSGQATVAATTEAINIEMPDIGAPYGFTPDAGETEDARSGLWKRIYARRVVSDRTVSTQAIIGDPEEYFFIGWAHGQDTVFTFRGDLLNFAEPWRDIHGYSGIQLSPLPDAAYDVDVRYLRKPHPLNTDQSVPRIPPEAIEVLIQKAISLVYEALGSHEIASLAVSTYQQRLITLTKRYGSLPTGVFRKRLGRAHGHSRRGYRFLIDER
jgi:hypothetical protein